MSDMPSDALDRRLVLAGIFPLSLTCTARAQHCDESDASHSSGSERVSSSDHSSAQRGLTEDPHSGEDEHSDDNKVLRVGRVIGWRVTS